MTGRTARVRSLFQHRQGTREVEIDPYANTALADDLAGLVSWQYRHALADRGEPPKMFNGGLTDLPSFTASGIDLQILLQVPARCRHAIAAERDLGTAYEMIQKAASNPEAAYDHPSLTEAVERIQAWSDGPALTATERFLRDDEPRRRQQERQQAINKAFETGGDAASKALMRQFEAEDAAEQAEFDEVHQSLIGVMHMGIDPSAPPSGPMAQPHMTSRATVDTTAPAGLADPNWRPGQ